MHIKNIYFVLYLITFVKSHCINGNQTNKWDVDWGSFVEFIGLIQCVSHIDEVKSVTNYAEILWVP